MDERINYVSQFINIRRFQLTDYEIDRLVAFVDRRNELNGKRKTSKGLEQRASSSEGRYDVREDNEYTKQLVLSEYLIQTEFKVGPDSNVPITTENNVEKTAEKVKKNKTKRKKKDTQEKKPSETIGE